MFGVDSSELLIIVIVALVVIGPKDLPRVLYKVGKVVGQARGMARHFRSGIDAMIREAELEDLQKQWAQENARIMAEHPLSEIGGEMKPLADETASPQLPAPESQPVLAQLAPEDLGFEGYGVPDPAAPPAPAVDMPAADRPASVAEADLPRPHTDGHPS